MLTTKLISREMASMCHRKQLQPFLLHRYNVTSKQPYKRNMAKITKFSNYWSITKQERRLRIFITANVYWNVMPYSLVIKVLLEKFPEVTKIVFVFTL